MAVDPAALYVGLDSSTQSLSAVVVEVRGREGRVAWETSLVFDDVLPHYATKHGVLPSADPAVALSPPRMWAEALDLVLERLSKSGVELDRVTAISGSAQQHGSVYLNGDATRWLASLDPGQPLAAQVARMLAWESSPIWMDASTEVQCREIADAVGGHAVLAQRTGSRAFERFTAAQIRKLFVHERARYVATDRVHVVSSFLASLLIGAHSPIDQGDGSGMNLMELSSGQWWMPAVEATAPNLAARLPPIVSSTSVVGRLSPYWQRRHGLPDARVVAWSGDNPSSLIGVGLVHPGRVAVSLGTSDTIFAPMPQPRVDPGGTGHVFATPLGEYMGLTCFSNGSLARERIRDSFGLTWDGFSRALEDTPTGNNGRLLLPWFEPEITPTVTAPGVHRFGLSAGEDPSGHVRAVVEAQQMAMARHSRWMSVPTTIIHATGGAAANKQILQVMADVFGAAVQSLQIRNSAALGAALRAWHAERVAEGQPLAWDDVVGPFIRSLTGDLLRPDSRRHAIYRELMPIYEACESYALGVGADPAPLLERFRQLVARSF